MTSVAAPSAELATTGRKTALAYLALAGVVLMWGMGPPLSKLIKGPPTTIAPTRVAMAVPLTYLVLRAQGGRPSIAAVRKSMWGGLFFGANIVVFFFALRHASIATITLVGVLQPVIIGIFAVRLFGEHPTRWGIVWTIVAIAGVVGAVLTAGKNVRATPLGLTLALVTTACISCYLLASRQARRTLATNEYLFGVMVWATLVTVLPLLIAGPAWGRLRAVDWLWMVVVLIGPGWLGHLLMSWAITEVPMSVSSLQMLPATVVSIAAAWPINHERVTVAEVLFGLVTLSAVGLVVHGPLRHRSVAAVH
jgi:probable blue pigment (indigoidine) exporter